MPNACTKIIAISAMGLALGNLVGGMRIIRTVGMKFFPIRPIHGFSAETASAQSGRRAVCGSAQLYCGVGGPGR